MGGFSKLKKLFSRSPRGHSDTDTDEQRGRHHAEQSRQQDGRRGGDPRVEHPASPRPLSYGGGLMPGYPPPWQYPQGLCYNTPSNRNRHSQYHLPLPGGHSAWYYPQGTPTLEVGRRQEQWSPSPSRTPSSANQLQMRRSNMYLPPNPGITSAYQTIAYPQGYNYNPHMTPRPAVVYVPVPVPVHNHYYITTTTTNINTGPDHMPRPPDVTTHPPSDATHQSDDAVYQTANLNSLDNDAGASGNAPLLQRSSTWLTDSSHPVSTIHVHGSYHGGHTLTHVNSVNIGNDNRLSTTD